MGLHYLTPPNEGDALGPSKSNVSRKHSCRKRRPRAFQPVNIDLRAHSSGNALVSDRSSSPVVSYREPRTVWRSRGMMPEAGNVTLCCAVLYCAQCVMYCIACKVSEEVTEPSVNLSLMGPSKDNYSQL